MFPEIQWSHLAGNEGAPAPTEICLALIDNSQNYYIFIGNKSGVSWAKL